MVDREKLSVLLQAAQAFAQAMAGVEDDLSSLDNLQSERESVQAQIKSEQEAAKVELGAVQTQTDSMRQTLAEVTAEVEKAKAALSKAHDDAAMQMALMLNAKGKELQILQGRVDAVQVEHDTKSAALKSKQAEHDQVAASLDSLAKRLLGR